jgi:peptidoglycan/LPS O-acetylase OafA/YrhL
VFGLLLLTFFVSVFKSTLLNRWLTNRYVTAIGGACYSLYLLHYAVIFMTMTATRSLTLPWFPATFLLQYAISIVAVLVIGMLFFRWCERPFMQPDWPQEFWLSIRRSVSRARASG